MVKRTTETTVTLAVPFKDLCRALGLPKWGRLELGNLLVKNADTAAWSKVEGAIPAFSEETQSGCVTFRHYRTKHSQKRLR